MTFPLITRKAHLSKVAEMQADIDRLTATIDRLTATIEQIKLKSENLAKISNDGNQARFNQ